VNEHGIGDDPGLKSSDIEREAASQEIDTEAVDNTMEWQTAVLGAAQPVLARIERGARTNNPVGLNGKECARLFDFINLQAMNHEAATAIMIRMQDEYDKAQEEQSDWKKDESGLVVPT